MDDEYLTINEVAFRLKMKPKTIRNKIAAGIFKKGVHYVRPKGMRPRFKWRAVQAWLEEEQNEGKETSDGIPMARGYFLGQDKLTLK